MGTGATIGAVAVIAPGATVGPHALVALGAVVIRDIPAHGLVIGDPARHVGRACRCGHSLDTELRCTNRGTTGTDWPPGTSPCHWSENHTSLSLFCARQVMLSESYERHG
ncbi:hypothetical protein ACFV8T_30215 [Streptomyces sp. NPDC059832]|uniref:hypothetical protein n=1 Tax=Streptomyces sp. NPDC059832 TaxID=3346966 RepID=UPI00365C5D4C